MADVDHNEASSQPRERQRWRPIMAAVVLILAGFLLFARLGHADLWDDEAYTALLGEGICRTGDTSVVLGKNLLAFGYGWSVRNLRDRFFPPLPFYMTAAGLKMFGETAFAVRLPFALCGLATFALIIAWLWKDQADGWTWALVLFGLLVNVTFLLYFRQCRYYGVILFMSVLLAYLYLHWPAAMKRQWLILIPLTGLLASNYINFAAAVACVFADWLLWGRQTMRVSRRNALILGGAQCAIAVVFLSIWNPLGAKPPMWTVVTSTFSAKAEHLWWNVRDMSVNEFFIAPLILLGVLIWLKTRDRWLARGGVAALIYFAAVSYLAPRGVGGFAEVRYFCPLIPLCIALEARTLRLGVGQHPVMALLYALPLFGSNILSGSTLFDSGVVPVPFRSTIIPYLRQLRDPPTECYTVTSDWVNANIPVDESILVLPQFSTYPLMFHAPAHVYAWQLPDPPPPQFQGFAPIQYEGRIAPHYIILFGREGWKEYRTIHLPDNAPGYSIRQTLPVFSMDLLKPELFFHVFDSTPPYDPHFDAVYVLENK